MEKHDKIISIFVPIYNVEPYLERCITSLISQSYHDIEIILVDDGSPDNCPDICDRYAKTDNRIKVIHKENGGLSSARNQGIDVASGNWLMFVDSDDYVEHNFCSSAIEKIQENNCDIVIFGYNDIYEDQIVSQPVTKNDYIISSKEALSELCSDKILSFAWNKIYKADLFASGVRYPKNMLYEDIGTTYKLFDKANTICITSSITYNYRKRTNSILGSGITDKGAIDWYRLEKERFRFVTNKYPEITPKILQNYLSTILLCYNTIAGQKGYNEIKKAMEEEIASHYYDSRQHGIRLRNLWIISHYPYIFRFLKTIFCLAKKLK